MKKLIIRIGFVGIFFLMLSVVLIGCGGGGGSGGDGDEDGSSGNPSIEVLPASHDFGTVTTGNSPAPLEVKINNNGTTALAVQAIGLSDINNFTLNVNGGSSPCGSLSPTIAAGGRCTFEVEFKPTTDGLFGANVSISSNDVNTPTNSIQLEGIAEPVINLKVRINEVKVICGPGEVTAYISVTDQGGYPVIGLSKGDFTILQDQNNIDPTSLQFVSEVYTNISIAIAMDYSGSITQTPDAVQDMENGLVDFVQDLAPGDEAEIIKFDTEVAVVQPFTSDKILLESKILEPFDRGDATLLYDAVFQGIEDANARVTTERKAIIAITDGDNDDALSTHTLDQVIANADMKKTPIFTIGIGGAIDEATLTKMADDTGGLFYEAISSDNLRNIYQQLSSVLFENQYILKFSTNPALGAGGSSDLSIGVDFQGIKGSDTRIISCP